MLCCLAEKECHQRRAALPLPSSPRRCLQGVGAGAAQPPGAQRLQRPQSLAPFLFLPLPPKDWLHFPQQESKEEKKKKRKREREGKKLKICLL